MKLTVVGCSGSVSGPESPASSYLVQAVHEGRLFSMVLDLGPGALGALYRYVDPRDVDAIGLSHLHADHCLDVCAFYVAGKYSSTAPWPRRPVYGPGGTALRLARADDVPRSDGSLSEAGPSIAEHFDYRDWQPGQQIGPFRVRTVGVDHPVEAYAIRIDEDGPDGGSLVFTGDTGPCPALAELATGADLLLAEAAFLDAPGNPPGIHLSGRDAAELAASARVGTLLLTHIPPWHDASQVLADAQPHFAGPVELAHPGASWSIGAP